MEQKLYVSQKDIPDMASKRIQVYERCKYQK